MIKKVIKEIIITPFNLIGLCYADILNTVRDNERWCFKGGKFYYKGMLGIKMRLGNFVFV